MKSSWSDPYLTRLFLTGTPLIDVRAPVEYNEGAIPHSINLPIMVDEERAHVGTCYKENGQAAAIELGHRLVSGEVKEARVRAWARQIEERPDTEVFCFRGGLRSQISCQWLREAGIQKDPIDGGYKRMRRFFLSWLEEGPVAPLYRIGGLTGSGKTQFINTLAHSIDIEGLAAHRGSAFGNHATQPAQITFENALALELLKLREQKSLVVEDESATLGKVSIPKRIFTLMRNSPLVVLKVDKEKRLQNIFNDYVRNSDCTFFLAGLERIQKRLSKKNYTFLKDEITRAFSRGRELEDHIPWIDVLLEQYYDPLYLKGLKHNASLIIFEGNEDAVREFLTSVPSPESR